MLTWIAIQKPASCREFPLWVLRLFVATQFERLLHLRHAPGPTVGLPDACGSVLRNSVTLSFRESRGDREAIRGIWPESESRQRGVESRVSSEVPPSFHGDCAATRNRIRSQGK